MTGLRVFTVAVLPLLLLAGCTADLPNPPGPTTPPPITSTTPTTTTPPQRTACYPKPSACGYPDATNTGYKPAGGNPTANGVSYNADGDLDVTTAGAVVDEKLISGCVNVKAPNVTIKRSLLKGCRSFFNIRVFPGAGDFVIEDSEVDGSGTINNAAFVDDGTGPVTMRRVDMHDVADGPHPGEDWLIVDSYIHDLARCAVCHNDTIQSAGARNVTLRHNTLVNLAGTLGPDGGMNAVVRIATEQGPVTGFLVEDNLLVGGNFFVQVRSQGSGPPTGVVVRKNRGVRGQTPDGQPYPRFGPWDYVGIPVTLDGNVWDHDDSPIGP